MESVAVIGAGPAGLASARWLQQVGFNPVIFEQCERIGGQWSGDQRASGIWPSMRTNTSRVVTAFSDLAHTPTTPTYPTNQEILAYLIRYAEQFGLLSKVRLATQIVSLDRGTDGAGWVLRSIEASGQQRDEFYSRVVVASGRFNSPLRPEVPGINKFSGACGVSHTFSYREPERYRGRRVLVLGCAVSALEIACDLSMMGAARVVCANRRQRYVLQKIIAGIPVECMLHTRFAAISHVRLPAATVAADLKQFIETHCGNPRQFGAPAPPDNVFEAGLTQCQYFLPLVAEGRIEVRPWVSRIVDRNVYFADGSADEFDAILCGTGFQLQLPFLSARIRRVLDLDPHHLDLHKYTFHPDLPGLAFVAMFQVAGPYWPAIELNARWIAYVWSGLRNQPTSLEMADGITAYRSRRGGSQLHRMPVLTVDFARETGVEPSPSEWPDLAGALLFGALSPSSFRLIGPHAQKDAPTRTADAACQFGAMRAPGLSDVQRARLAALAVAAGDPLLAELGS